MVRRLTKFDSILTLRRKQLNMTQSEVVEAVGISKSAIARWELGYVQVVRDDSMPAIKKLAALYDIDVDTVMNTISRNYQKNMKTSGPSQSVPSELFNARTRLGLTIEDVSELTGVPAHYIRAYEIGKCDLDKINPDNIAALANLYEISEDDTRTAIKDSCAYFQGQYTAKKMQEATHFEHLPLDESTECEDETDEGQSFENYDFHDDDHGYKVPDINEFIKCRMYNVLSFLQYDILMEELNKLLEDEVEDDPYEPWSSPSEAVRFYARCLYGCVDYSTYTRVVDLLKTSTNI